MNRIFFLLLVLVSCSPVKKDIRESVSLAGEWRFRIDSLDKGVQDRWYDKATEETITLPGSMAENGKGNEVTLKTDWTGDIVDRSYFTNEKYARYRQPGNIKIPFWLKPSRYYKGVAWYQKEIQMPDGWKGRNITLFLERPHWETTVFVNGERIGTENSLAVPHQYDITEFLREGPNLISIRVDNRMIIPVGINSHSVSDHTQGNWNGISGRILLNSTSTIFLSDINIYPDLRDETAKVIIRLRNKTGAGFAGKLKLTAENINNGKNNVLKAISQKVSVTNDDTQITVIYPMGKHPAEWDEFNPNLYILYVDLTDKKGNLVDRSAETFGMREFTSDRTRFSVNGRQVFLRGTTECCVFPLTGYPPSDSSSWMKVLRTVKSYGLNHVRFHSYCPPEAAFEAADNLGIYFHVECSSWANQGTSIGDGKEIDRFIYAEGDRIMREYGNHPSFCMLAYGNEPAGKNQNAFLGKLLSYWKEKDTRRVYTSAAGWPIIPENDYNLTPAPRIQQWGDGLKSVINAEPPRTDFDYSDFISKFSVPVVSHEIGQWCVYPDFKEISKYTGPLKSTNFEIFRETLNENSMGDQAEQFLMASGKLQSLCYKAEIEAALRTRGFAGFQMLQLHDFPGQGTALVGILNAFFESKGYITPDEFRMFCNETVPLARIRKMVLRSDEPFHADIELAHFGRENIKNAIVTCTISSLSGNTVYKESFNAGDIVNGNCIPVGSVSFRPDNILSPQKFKLEASVDGTSFRNNWDFWVYPAVSEIVTGKVLIKERIDAEARDYLKRGGSVLLMTFGHIGKENGSEVAIGFSSIFWNTAWTNNQPPHTLGILCNPEHPLFKDFPTEYHSNWQWWDPVMHSQVMIINNLPSDIKPLIQPIDTWFENRRLALAFEAKASGGKLLVCSVDLKNLTEDRIVSKQLLTSILNYMNSTDFDPVPEVDLNMLSGIVNKQ